MTGHDFAVDADARTLRGILLPYGEVSRLSASGAEPLRYGPGVVTLPRDPSVVTLNLEHGKYDPLGRATVLEHRPAEGGVYAEFTIAATDEGDAYLADPNRVRKLSPEIAGIVRRGVEGLAGRLTGAAVTREGAWAGAHLFALGDITDEDEDEPQTTQPAPNETPASPATEPAPQEEPMPTIVPDTERTVEVAVTLDGLFSAIQRNDPDMLRPYASAGESFALAQVQQSGPTTVTIGADTQETGYLGELWQRRPYARRFVPLVQSVALTNYVMQGWRWVTEPVVADYSGNATEVPSAAVDTEPVPITAQRLASGHRLDRRFEDFNDQSVISSFLDKQTESYARATDTKCLAAMVAAAQTTTPGTVPTGVAKGLAAIVDGALGVVNTENRPSFAVVSPELWRDIVLMKDDDKLGFLNAGFGLEDGDLDGFKIVPGNVGTGKVLVGAREAFQFFELPGVPIRVSGIQPGNGATDIALFGYWASLATNAGALRIVTTA
ncbi:phage major capsid protein [Microbacterium sp. RG1]|uniref:phage major capsid protein n=1 Tax=Microbacterium sp. RG1 TaxID=2489212 RepID=UPI0010CA3519|nr:hypothetical protein [Microbacterium sp. RG1]QCQ16991.1 hypothetical protein EHF32_09815 [Microbacterium sp. RG1]